MADRDHAMRIGLQVVLAIVIVGLAYWLYLSITEPYKVVEERQRVTEVTRDRMDNVRAALIQFEREYGRFPGALDTLSMYISDSLDANRRDSLFGEQINPDSLIYSPRTGREFEYALNDTSNVDIYLLSDPDTDDFIGSERPDVTRLNAASWE